MCWQTSWLFFLHEHGREQQVLSVPLSALHASCHHLSEVSAGDLSIAVVVETFYEDFPVFCVELRDSQSSHHIVHLVQRERSALEEVTHHFLLDIELCQFEIFEQLMQL